MKIIFEIASCPWKDFLSTNQSLKHDRFPLDLNLHTQIMNQELQQFDHCGAELSIRAMLLRKQYGGMHWYVLQYRQRYGMAFNKFLDLKNSNLHFHTTSQNINYNF